MEHPRNGQPSWETPKLVERSIRETRSDDGGNTDTLGGGIFLFDEPVKPPRGRMTISEADRSRVAEFLREISSAPDRLEAAVFNPSEAMEKSGLTKDQIRIAKGILSHLAQ